MKVHIVVAHRNIQTFTIQLDLVVGGKDNIWNSWTADCKIICVNISSHSTSLVALMTKLPAFSAVHKSFNVTSIV